jgi:hypothetical protein
MFIKAVTVFALVSVVSSSIPLGAQQSDSLQIWHQADLKAVEESLHSRIPQGRKYALQDLSVFGDNLIRMVYSTGAGRAEIHEHQLGVVLVESGEGTLIWGGTMLNPTPQNQPGEFRGTGIEGGQRYELRPGDIVKLPPKVVTQVVVPEGKTLTLISIHIHVD